MTATQKKIETLLRFDAALRKLERIAGSDTAVMIQVSMPNDVPPTPEIKEAIRQLDDAFGEAVERCTDTDGEN